MAPLLRTGSVNPFRFWPPKYNPLAFLYFRPQNLFLLWISFRSTGVSLKNGSASFLKRLHKGKGSRLVISNHISFIDPHILTELNFISPGLRFHWLAGVEPFERPFLRWHMQNAGAFSVDRGMVDNRSITFAQRLLNEGSRPLLLFPEGEATYQPTEMAPFYYGAALMALQAQHHWRHEPDCPVTLFPATMIYGFVNNPTSAIRRDSLKLYHSLHQSLRELNNDAIIRTLPHLPRYLDATMTTPQLLRHLVSWVLLWVEQTAITDGYNPCYERSLEERLSALQQWWFADLISEHFPEDSTDIPDTYDALMTQKNRLRSRIVRKRFAPTLPELENALSQVRECLEHQTFIPEKRLYNWELEVMGFTYPDEPQPARLERLIEFMEGMREYAMFITDATEADKARWVRQTEETRRVKLISLILSDLHLLQEESDQRQWLIQDGLLTKCELLAYGQFVYRGLKRFEIELHEPFTVNEFMAQYPGASRRELIRLMTDRLSTQIRQPLMAEINNSVSDFTNAVDANQILV